MIKNLPDFIMLISILDNDFYKFTMQLAVMKLFPRAEVRYQLIDRKKNKFPDGFANALKKSIDQLAKLKLLSEEKDFLDEKCLCLDPVYTDFLKGYRYDPEEVLITQKKDKLSVIIKGYWYRTVLWEVPLLAIISELYFKITQQKPYADSKVIETLRKKTQRFKKKKIKFADFGTRRRYSYNNHKLIIKKLSENGSGSFIGTSNVHFAMLFNLTPIGTHAHEWFMFHSAKYGYKTANITALKHWTDIYKGDLSIALADTFTSDFFLKKFDKKLSKLFDGVRHDSGDPFKFTDKIIAHYKKLNINPKEKTIIFSDGLTPDKVEKISDYCMDKIKASFGIGTNLTNDVGVTPLDIVIKMIGAKPEKENWIPVIKLTDAKEKCTGDLKSLKLCKKLLNIAD